MCRCVKKKKCLCVCVFVCWREKRERASVDNTQHAVSSSAQGALTLSPFSFFPRLKMMMMMVLLALEAIKYGCGTYMGSRRPFAPSPDVKLYLFFLTSHRTKEIFFFVQNFGVGGEISDCLCVCVCV